MTFVRTLRRSCLVAVLPWAALAGAASAATPASVAKLSISCTAVSFHYGGFPKGTDSVNESVTIDGATVYSQATTFTGPETTHSVPILVSAGKHRVVAGATWNTNGASGRASFDTTFTNCNPPATQLAFDPAGQPHGADVNQPITNSDFNTSGGPVLVDLLDGNGNIVPSSNAQVTVVLGSNPGGSTLSGTTTVNATNGVASFSGLSLNNAANGYTLVASSGSLTPATSASFNEQSTSAACIAGLSCMTTSSTQNGSTQVTANPDPNNPDQGFLTESVNAQGGKELVCTGHVPANPDTYEFFASSINRSKTVTETITNPNTGVTSTMTAFVNDQQVCYGAPYGFVTKSGAQAVAGTLPDGTAGFIGLLPDCGAPGATVCIQSRTSQPDPSSPLGFDVIVTYFVPAGLPGDPWSR
jgi:hypothetical protein